MNANIGTKPGGYSWQSQKIGQRNIEFSFRRVYVGKVKRTDYIRMHLFNSSTSWNTVVQGFWLLNVIDAPGIENIPSLLAISIYVKVILLLDAAVPFTICVLLCWERLGPINTSKPFIEAIRKSLTFKLLTVYDNLNWSPTTTVSGAIALKLTLPLANKRALLANKTVIKNLLQEHSY